MSSTTPVIILCGGKGTRMGDTLTKKELVDIDGRPVLWHVMRIFSAYGHNQFALALGHHGEQVRRFFLEYETMSRDVVLRVGDGATATQYVDELDHAPWDVTLVDTGLETEKASRIGRIAPHIADAERIFVFVTYGEALADIDLDALMAFHKAHGKLATITGIQVKFQYGVIEADEAGLVAGFVEKPPLPHWINGGFMIFERAALELMQQNLESLDLEREVLPALTEPR